MKGFTVENVDESSDRVRTAMTIIRLVRKGSESLEAIVGRFPRILVDEASYRGLRVRTLFEKRFDGIDDERWSANIPTRDV